MKTLIIFNSMSGFTEKYATMLKEALNEETDTVPLPKFKPKMLSDYDRAVFMARVINGQIDGFKTVVKYAELFASKYTSIVAVGMSKPSAALYTAVENANIPYKLKGIPLFCVRGGFDMEKLRGGNKLMINMFRSRLMKAQSRTVQDMAALNFLSAKTDKTDSEQLKPLIEYLESGIFTPPQDDGEDAGYWIDLDEYLPKSAVSEDIKDANA